MNYFVLASVAAIVVGALCGLVGTVVVLRQRTFFAQALTHAAFPGAVAATVLSIAMPVGAGVSALAVVGMMLGIGRMKRQGMQVAAGIVLTVGFASGVIIQALNPQVPVGLDTFLIGSILTVTPADIIFVLCVLVLALGVMAAFGKEIVFDTFDPVATQAAGYRTWLIELVVLVLVTATVVSVLPAIGAILAIALLAGPAAAARALCRTTGQMMVVAPLLGVVSGVGGLALSLAWHASAGAFIALVSALIFVVAVIFSQVRGRSRVDGNERGVEG